jgi:putative Mg2+ transporter-C (MgtC) family protein
MAMNSIWNDNYGAIALHLVIALAAGGIIGLERSYHGRPAGFRTHALVCLSCCMLMILTVYQETWFSAYSLEQISVDPTRMAQGIMTGIGFLGAGVIMKEGLTVRGLTTAASIWITAGIGIMIYANLTVAFVRNATLPEADLRSIVERKGFVIANMNYSVAGEGRTFEYQMVIHSPDRDKTRELSEALNALPSVTGFRIAPTGD